MSKSKVAPEDAAERGKDHSKEGSSSKRRSSRHHSSQLGKSSLHEDEADVSGGTVTRKGSGGRRSASELGDSSHHRSTTATHGTTASTNHHNRRRSSRMPSRRHLTDEAPDESRRSGSRMADLDRERSVSRSNSGSSTSSSEAKTTRRSGGRRTRSNSNVDKGDDNENDRDDDPRRSRSTSVLLKKASSRRLLNSSHHHHRDENNNNKDPDSNNANNTQMSPTKRSSVRNSRRQMLSSSSHHGSDEAPEFASPRRTMRRGASRRYLATEKGSGSPTSNESNHNVEATPRMRRASSRRQVVKEPQEQNEPEDNGAVATSDSPKKIRRPMNRRGSNLTNGARRMLNRRGSANAMSRRNLMANVSSSDEDEPSTTTDRPANSKKVIGRTVGSATILVHVLQARNIVAMDSDLLGRPTTSDPYCKAYLYEAGGWKCVGSTDIAAKTVNPTWQRGLFQVKLGCDQARALLRSGEKIELRLFDADHSVLAGNAKKLMSETEARFMGCVQVPLLGSQEANWYRIHKRSLHHNLFSPGATGDLQVSVQYLATAAPDIVWGSTTVLPPHLFLGFSWKHQQEVTLDTACIAIHKETGVWMPSESVVVHHSQDDPGSAIMNQAQSIVKWGSTRKQKHLNYRPDGEETWQLELEKVSPDVGALFFVVSVRHPRKTLADLGTLKVRCLNTDSDDGLCRYVPEIEATDTSMILWRFARSEDKSSSKNNNWELCALGKGYPIVREFGTLLPQLQALSQDVIVEPKSSSPPTTVIRSAWMGPGDAIHVESYLPLDEVAVQIQWATKYKCPLDTVVLLLDKDFRKVDEVTHQIPQSRDNSLFHCGGDQGDGDERDDKTLEKILSHKIEVDLTRVSQRTHYICFAMGPYGRQIPDPMLKLSFQLLDADGNVGAQFRLAQPSTWTGALLGCFVRSNNGQTWNWCTTAQASLSTSTTECANELRDVYKVSPPSTGPTVPPHTMQQLPVQTPVPKESIMIPEDYLTKVANIW